MKNVLMFLGFMALSLLLRASPLVSETPILSVGTGTTVSISTSAWTVVPTASTMSTRSGIKVSNPSSNTANVACILDTAAPTEATTVRPIEIQPGENPFVPARTNLNLYCVSLNTSAESIHVQEVGQ